MQNQKEKLLLSFLYRDCGLNKFTVVDKQDILSCFQKRNYIEEGDLDNLIQALERKGFIKIKYDDENVYCLSVLRECEEEKKEIKTKLPSLFFWVFLGSFLGGLLSSLVINLIFIN